MATVEITPRVCHIVGSHVTGPEAIIGGACGNVPIWEPLPCVEVSFDAIACSPQSLTLTAPSVLSLPASPVYEEAP